jgi:hypothetical protein
MLPEFFLSTIAGTYIVPVMQKNGIGALPSREQEKIVAPLIEQAVIRMIAAITRELSDTGKVQFKNMVDKNENREEIWSGFWREHLPEYQIVVENALQEYQKELEQTFVA